MSREIVDFVLGAYARFNAGERVPELWFWHPDAEFQAARKKNAAETPPEEATPEEPAAEEPAAGEPPVEERQR